MDNLNMLKISWHKLLQDCKAKNEGIHFRKFSINREKLKNANFQSMIRIFDGLISDPSIYGDGSCPIVNSVTRNSSSFEKDDERIQQCAEGHVLTINDKVNHTAVMSSVDLTPDMQQKPSDENHMLFKTVKYLKNLSEGIPTYDEKIHVCRNSEIFESYVEKFELSNEHKNKLFKIWIPAKFARHLEIKQCYQTKDWLSFDDIQRLKNLIDCTADLTPLEIAKSLVLSRKENTFTFLATFKRTYKALDINEEVIKNDFIRQFHFLNPTILALAAEKNSLNEVGELLNRVRLAQKNLPKTKNKPILKRKLSNDNEKSNRSQFIKTRRTLVSKTSYEDRRKIHVNYISYYQIQKGHEELRNHQTRPDLAKKELTPPPPVTFPYCDLSTQKEFLPLLLYKNLESKLNFLLKKLNYDFQSDMGTIAREIGRRDLFVGM